MPTYKYNQRLPKEVEKRLDDYIERIKKINWFKPTKDFKRKDAEKQIKVALDAFGVKASVKWCSLKKEAAWGAVRDAAWDAVRDAAWGAARDAAWGAAEILVLTEKKFNKKYPTGAFLHLIPLWEMGLYPCGVIDGKFVIYEPVIENTEEKCKACGK